MQDDELVRVRIVSTSLLRRLGTWSPTVVLPVVEEMERRAIEPDDMEGASQCYSDIRFLQEHAQKTRVLPLPRM